MLTLYNVVSSDGFIATKDGNEDFIPDEMWGDFLELCAKYDAVILGKNAYASIQSFGKKAVEPFEKLRIEKIVVTRDKDFKPKNGYATMNSLYKSATLRSNMLLCSGPKLNTAFLNEKLIDRIILNKLSVKIGDGIPQFDEDFRPKLTPKPNLNIKIGNNRTLEVFDVEY